MQRWKRERERHGRARRNARDRAHYALRVASNPRHFVGCDGEGGGVDSYGRQVYRLLRIGDNLCYNGNAELTTIDCLEFILDQPSYAIYVGFAFGYDATQILKHMDADKQTLLFKTMEERSGQRYVFWKDYAIDYRPKQYFRVARVVNNRIVRGSSRTIYEVFGFFQCSFLKALKNFNIGNEHLEMIERNKSARSSFDLVTDEMIEYNRLECVLLAQLMERFREVCIGCGLKPTTWNGAGKLASALHRQHGTLRRDEMTLPVSVILASTAAYYGGRFEVTHTGSVNVPIYGYDIRSAYPAAMRGLPCLKCGGWKETDTPSTSMYLADITFRHAKGTRLCGFPIRNKQGRIFYPREGSGVYWGCEIEAAQKLGAQIFYNKPVIEYEQRCQCNLFTWVEELYEYRKRIGSSTQGYPIKLGINSLYGKFAQRVGGGGPWTNHTWAGLVTARTRAWLMEAASCDPGAVIMLATDGIYSKRPLMYCEDGLGVNLGEWERSDYPRMHVVQPGLYWGPPKPKTRGVSASILEQHIPAFERAWDTFIKPKRLDMSRIPSVTIPINIFIGMRLALAWGKPMLAGSWKVQERNISYDWIAKRGEGSRRDGYVETLPHDGRSDLRSVVYTPVSNPASVMDAQEMELEAMPDHTELLPQHRG